MSAFTIGTGTPFPPRPAGRQGPPARAAVEVTALWSRGRLAQLEEPELIELFLAGEERAFGELVERYQTRLLNFLYRVIGDRERSEDLLQVAFLRVYRHLHGFDRSKRFSTWIYSITANLAKNELRDRARSPEVLLRGHRRAMWERDAAAQLEDRTTRPDDVYAKRQLRAFVAAAVEQLPPRHRQVFVLRELEGKSYSEIAEITGARVGTVKSRLNRARTAFAAIIGPALA